MVPGVLAPVNGYGCCSVLFSYISYDLDWGERNGRNMQRSLIASLTEKTAERFLSQRSQWSRFESVQDYQDEENHALSPKRFEKHLTPLCNKDVM